MQSKEQTSQGKAGIPKSFGLTASIGCSYLLRVCQRWHRFPVGEQPSDRVDHDDLPAHLSGIVHGRSGSAAPHSVINGQQDGSMFYQKAVAIQHTIFVVIPTDINNIIRYPEEKQPIGIPHALRQ